MNKKSFWKWLVFIFLLAFSLALVYPPSEKIPLGIDLKGGTSFVLEVQTEGLAEDVARDALERALQIIEGRINALGTREPIVYSEPKMNRIVVQIPGMEAEDRDAMVQMLESAAYLEFRMVDQDSDVWTEENFQKGLSPDGYKIVSYDQPMQDGSSRTMYYYVKDQEYKAPEGEDGDTARERLGKFAYHAGNEFMLVEDVRNNQKIFTPYYVNVLPQLTGEALKTAGVDRQQLGQPIVTLKFNSKGAKKFGHITGSFAPGGDQNPNPNVSRQLAIVLDGSLYSAPRIDEPIYGGEAIIRGNFSAEEATRLSIVLRAGSLPAPVKVIEERGVDPTLGKDSIRTGIQSMIYGSVALVLFMMAYYMVGGVVANLSLLINVLLLPFFMMLVAGFMGSFFIKGGLGGDITHLPTLTLPGIAGIILIIGMAVDANVLIYERIREEQLAGKRFKAALQAGYEKAFSTIFDANITTLITGVILFWQGSGPIRGFAVTLCAGVISTMYVVLVVCRMILEWYAQKFDPDSMKMLGLFAHIKLDFIKYRYAAAFVSIAAIVATGAVFFKKGDANYGVDFTGGRSLGFEFTEKVPESEIRGALSGIGAKESFVQYMHEMVAGPDGVQKEQLEVKVAFEIGDAAKQVLLETFSSQGFHVVKEDSVGPQVGKELRTKGLYAIAWALLGIVLYVSYRFEFSFAVGAIVALLHDVLLTIGIYCLLDRQLSLPIVAALLTIVGYSVNDTIVVFDRIREDRKLMRDKSFREVANLSINQTLSRTTLTSGTTLITVVMLMLFGGGAINDFALALFIGITVGTYSSIFIATPITMLWFRNGKR